MKCAVSLASVLPFVWPALAGSFSVVDTYQGSDFLNRFDYLGIADPTHGYVNYVSKSTAMSKGLVSVSGTNFTLRADDRNIVNSSASGRDSVRIQSQKSYGSHVTVINLAHMPKGCGTWPAIWEVGPDWPNGGEVDIIEGTNDIPNQATLHTSSGCTMPALRDHEGTSLTNDCASNANSNTGCGVLFSRNNSYGHSFNLIEGGFYAMERSTTLVKVWFWPRTATNIPVDVKNGSNTINTHDWGRPQAFFPDTTCGMKSHFSTSNIIINLTFCGDFAGATYASSGCPGTCESFVKNNPDEMIWAYFLIMWLKVYQ
ncbi:endo-beta-glucanase [Vararia minispora EC-137]|uniref:Endo-beta-glucanase n=1 Tax=Vararia minispora EC-137 TaxID=1314806 RepID=A0ACB8QFW4_9AGAM|nr:endo-beta-glucanase [Vararia minispora EC-137]